MSLASGTVFPRVPSGIGVSTIGAVCSLPQEAKSKTTEKHSNTKAGSLEFPEGLL